MPAIALGVDNVNGIGQKSVAEQSVRDDSDQPLQSIKNNLSSQLSKVYHPLGNMLCLSSAFVLTGKDPEKEYYLPTSPSTENRVILDISRSVSVSYRCPKSFNFNLTFDLPKTPGTSPMVDPDLSNSNEEGKQALKIHKIRKRKMRKKHRIKWNKKYKFMIRLKGNAKKKKKEKIRAAKLKTYEDWMNEFNAETYIKEQLHQARRGGYRAKLFE